MDIKNDYSLLSHNTFGINVKARQFVEYTTVDDLRTILTDSAREAKYPAPWLHIGGGSNLLFGADYPGTVFHSAIRGFEVLQESDEDVVVKVGAGEVWDEFVAYTLQQGWSGAENLSLIPGEVGASAVQNIGAYGVEAKDLIQEVFTLSVFTGKPRNFQVDECRYGYRDSIFKQELKGQYVVTHVSYRLFKTPQYRLDYGNIRSELERRGGELSPEAVRRVIIDVRRSKLPDPKEEGNAGSFFMNPVIAEADYQRLLAQYPDMPHYPVGAGQVKVPAGWLIDRAGWKGRTVGHAGVHSRQALVLVNRGGATGEEVMQLARHICEDVKQTFGVEIHPEVNYII